MYKTNICGNLFCSYSLYAAEVLFKLFFYSCGLFHYYTEVKRHSEAGLRIKIYNCSGFKLATPALLLL